MHNSSSSHQNAPAQVISSASGKRIYINGSPKSKGSISSFLISLLKMAAPGDVFHPRTPASWPAAFAAMDQAEQIIIVQPLYVDGVAGHMLSFLEAWQNHRQEHPRKNEHPCTLYNVCNNGFIEGRQAEVQMHIMENFCSRTGLQFQGGLGFGGGVMLNVLRIMVMVFAILLVVQCVSSGLAHGLWLPYEALEHFGEQLLTLLVFGCLIFYQLASLAWRLRSHTAYGIHYTRILLPSFLFILATDIFYTVLSILQGGLFRGWLSKKKPQS